LRFRAIASDYDRTLANDGRVALETVNLLQRGRASGLKMILITGRALDDLKTVFAELSLFDLVVAENGALLFDPLLGTEEPLCDPPPETFIERLRKRKVPIAVGRRVVATIRPHEIQLLALATKMNLRLEAAFNRESVMILPSGVDKGTGLTAALAKLAISSAEIVGVGDAENDWAFLRLCGYSVAVANAIDSLKRQVDYVTHSKFGAGAAEVIERVIAGADLP
jgi:phosphoglycolate phosphatase (TIGR01487 family)